MPGTRLAVALALVCALAGSATADDVEPRSRSLLQRTALKGSAHMAVEPELGAAPEEVTDEYVLLKQAMPAVPATRVIMEKPVILIEHLKTGMRRTYTYALVQKVLDLHAKRGEQSAEVKSQREEQPQQQQGANPVMILVSVMIYISIMALLAHHYNKQYELPVADGSVPLVTDEFKFFKHHICAWYEEPLTCLMACACPAMRWGQTMYMTGFLSFWAAFFMYAGSNLMSAVPGGEIFGTLMFMAMTFYRQKMRETFDMHEQGGCSVLSDYCCACWCTPCVITQEARQLEDAYKAGHPAVKDIDLQVV
jgi:Cys-rich protein (TIGR01571 family)